MNRLATPLAAALLAVTTGCAAQRAERVRVERLTSQLDATVVTRPMDEAWQEVRRLLADAGFWLAEPDALAIGRELQPIVRLMSAGEATSESEGGVRTLETARSLGGVRYRAEARPAAGGVRIQLTRLETDRNDQARAARSRRDPDLELQLLRRLDAAAAAEVEARLRADPAPAAAPRAP